MITIQHWREQLKDHWYNRMRREGEGNREPI